MRSFVVALLLAVLMAPAWAGPRLSGTFVKGDSKTGVLVMKLSDGTLKRVQLQPGAISQRMGHGAHVGDFQPGEKVQVEVVGAMSDDPLEASSLLDEFSAMQRPTGPAPGTVYQVDTGGSMTVGGPMASLPYKPGVNSPSLPGPGAAIGIGGGQNVGAGNFNQFPNPPQGGTMTAQPAPLGAPSIGPAIGGTPNPLPQPNTGGQYGGPSGTDTISFTGQVMAVNAPQHTIWVQTTTFNNQPAAQRLMVVIPDGAQLVSPVATYMRIDQIRPGSTVYVAGTENAAGAVQARYVKTDK
ncbi:MAG: hypothetical protein ACYCW6_00400 [Candidatus Xenobia bacterium]